MPQEHDQQSVIWPQEMQDDPMNGGVGGDDDFSKFLDLDSEFQFAGLDNGQSGLDTPMGRLAFSHPNAPPPNTSPANFTVTQAMNLDMPAAGGPGAYSNHMHNAQQFELFQQQYQQMHMQHPYHVPPTPVSSEMHAAKYGQHVDSTGQLIFDRQQVSFTPLVSPAQTPLTHAYSMPQYGTADDFFSPLTSPAIEAQHAFSSARTTASPIDRITDSAGKPTSAPRNKRRKGSVSTRAGTRSVKQSPVVKPSGRRRKASLTNLSTDKINETLDQASGSQAKVADISPAQHIPAHVLGNTTRSSDDSISPEPLSESLMRPPPVPPPEKSPRGLGLARQDSSGNGVTPMTLMSLPSKQTSSGSGADSVDVIPEDSMEDMMLPDAAAPVPPPASEPGSVGPAGEEQATPTMSSKAAKVSASSTPRSMLPKSGSTDGFNKPQKIESRPGTSRGPKKRGSTTSAAISPALRPKISPSISPLVPASGPGMSHLSAETSALYLASKSNYQNIIDGTHLPGVSYPEALAENLSSKRTSHKIAEQGRRNRINVALKEIETLLPASITTPMMKKEKSANEAEADAAGKAASNAQGASKASTVEMAIVYIKSLQAELADTRDKLATVEKKLAAENSSADSQTSE